MSETVDYLLKLTFADLTEELHVHQLHYVGKVSGDPILFAWVSTRAKPSVIRGLGLDMPGELRIEEAGKVAACWQVPVYLLEGKFSRPLLQQNAFYILTLKFPLWLTQLVERNQICHAKAITDLLVQLFKSGSQNATRPVYAKAEIKAQTEQPILPQNYTQQNETDYHFIKRTLHRHGYQWLYGTQPGCHLVLTQDLSKASTPVSSAMKSYEYTVNPLVTEFYRVQLETAMHAPKKVTVRGYNPEAPQETILGEYPLDRCANNDPGFVWRVDEASNVSAAQRAKQVFEAKTIRQYSLQAEGQGILSAGQQVIFVGSSGLSRDWQTTLLQKVHWSLHTDAATAKKVVFNYTRIQGSPANLPHQEMPTPGEFPALLAGCRILPQNPNANGEFQLALDSMGHYRVAPPAYFDYDGKNTYCNIRRLHRMQSVDHRMHVPLASQSEVAVVFHQDNLEHPVVIGATNHAAHTTNTLPANAQDHVLQDNAKNRMSFVNQGSYNPNQKTGRQTAITFQNPSYNPWQQSVYTRLGDGGTHDANWTQDVIEPGIYQRVEGSHYAWHHGGSNLVIGEQLQNQTHYQFAYRHLVQADNRSGSYHRLESAVVDRHHRALETKGYRQEQMQDANSIIRHTMAANIQAQYTADQTRYRYVNTQLVAQGQVASNQHHNSSLSHQSEALSHEIGGDLALFNHQDDYYRNELHKETHTQAERIHINTQQRQHTITKQGVQIGTWVQQIQQLQEATQKRQITATTLNDAVNTRTLIGKFHFNPGDAQVNAQAAQVGPHYFQFRYLDQDSQAIPNLPYHLTLSDGTSMDGALDSHGQLMVASTQATSATTLTLGDKAACQSQITMHLNQLHDELSAVLYSLQQSPDLSQRNQLKLDPSQISQTQAAFSYLEQNSQALRLLDQLNDTFKAQCPDIDNALNAHFNLLNTNGLTTAILNNPAVLSKLWPKAPWEATQAKLQSLADAIRQQNYCQTYTDLPVDTENTGHTQAAAYQALNREATTSQLPKLAQATPYIPCTAPSPKPAQIAQIATQANALATTLTPKNQQQTSPNTPPLLEAIYATDEQCFYFLTQEDIKTIQTAMTPFQQAAKALYEAEIAAQQAKVDEKGNYPQAVAGKLFAARKQMNALLKQYIKSNGSDDALAEILILSDQNFNKIGWGYLPKTVLDKIKYAVQVVNELKDHVGPKTNIITYTLKNKNLGGSFQQRDYSYNKASGHSTVKSKNKPNTDISFVEAKEKLLEETGLPITLLHFDSESRENTLADITKDLDIYQNKLTHLKAGMNEKLFRYCSQLSVSATLSPKTKSLSLNGSYKGNLDLANARLNLQATFPGHIAGYTLKPTFGDDSNPLYLGQYRIAADLGLYEIAGASIMACGDIEISPNQNVIPGSKKAKGNLLKGILKKPTTSTNTNTHADLSAFAGIELGCELNGSLQWYSPETVKPLQNPNKNSEHQGLPLQGEGNPTWQELADLSMAVEADMGIGLSLGIGIGYHKDTFVLQIHARVVFGEGAAGKIQFAIDKDHLLKLLSFVYHQLKNYNFTNRQIEEALFYQTSLETLGFITVASLWEGVQLIEYAKDGLEKAIGWFRKEISHFLHHESICEKLVTLANNILDNISQIEAITPYSKGRLLFHLSEYFTYIESKDPAPAQAMLKILGLIQSAGEWLAVLENVMALDPENLKGKTHALKGQETLLNRLSGNQIEQMIQLEQRLQDKANDLLQVDENTFHACIHAACKNMEKAKCDNGAAMVLICMQYASQNYRKQALVYQGVIELKVDINELNQLIQAANAYNIAHHSPSGVTLEEINRQNTAMGEAETHVNLSQVPMFGGAFM